MSRQRVSTGIDGLDTVLDGGLIPNRSYLIRGGPGTGKTTFGLHFLEETPGESLFITLDEKKEEIRTDAREMGFDLNEVQFLDLSPSSEFFSDDQQYDVLESSDVEWGPITQKIKQAVEEQNPDRIFIDSLTQFRHLSPDVYQFRKQVLSFVRFLLEQDVTVLMVSEEDDGEAGDEDLQFLSDSVFSLAADDVRSLTVRKFRGSDFQSGDHHIRITGEGLRLFPKELPYEIPDYDSGDLQQRTSGIDELDDLLGGGVEESSVTMLTGPSGVGKTTTGVQFLVEQALEGEDVVLYTFEEFKRTIVERTSGLGIPVEEALEKGTLTIEFLQPDEYTSREFVHKVKTDVSHEGYSCVMIDSFSGWSATVGSEDLDGVLRSLMNYLKASDVTTFLVNEVNKITGDFSVSEQHISHLTDNILFLRYVELRGQLRKVMGVLKKRMSDFEKTLREVEFTGEGIQLGEPMTSMQGILHGVPSWFQGAESDGEPRSAMKSDA